MVTAQLPGGSSVSFINEIREERKEFLTKHGAQPSSSNRTKGAKQRRTARLIRQLRSLGYRIAAPNPQLSQAQAQ